MKLTRSEMFEKLKTEDFFLRNIEGDYYMRIAAHSTYNNLKCFGKLKGRPEFEIAWYGTAATEIFLNGDPITKEEYESGRNQNNHPRLLH